MARRIALKLFYLVLPPLLFLFALLFTLLALISGLRGRGSWRREGWRKLSYGGRYFSSMFRGKLGEVADVLDSARDFSRFVVAALVALCVASGFLVELLKIGIPTWISAGPLKEVFSLLIPDLDRASVMGGTLTFGAGVVLAFSGCFALLLCALGLSVYVGLAFAVGEAMRVVMRYGGAATLFPDPGDAIPGGRLVLCQISDLHITAGGREPYEIEEGAASWPEGGARPDTAELTRRLRRLVAEISALKPPLLALTGDMTDLGEEAQWAELERALAGVPEGTHVLMVPGNHDVAINVGTSPDPHLTKRAEREQRFVDVLTRLERGPFQPPLPDPPRKRARRRRRGGPGSIAGLFPRRIVLDGGIRIFGLDSNRYRSRFVGSSAIGQLGGGQLRRFARELNAGSGPVIVLLHHHVARLAGPISLDDTFMIAIDGTRLLEMLAAYQQKDPKRNTALVMHGHKHLAFFGHYRSKSGGRVSVYAHPSSTLGHETAGQLDGVARFAAVRLTEDGIFRVETHPLRPERAAAEATPAVKARAVEAEPAVKARAAEAEPAAKARATEAEPAVKARAAEAEPAVKARAAEAEPAAKTSAATPALP